MKHCEKEVLYFFEEILRELRAIRRMLETRHHIHSFTIQGESMLPIAPGFAPGFTATPLPAGTTPAPGNPVAWTSSDTTNAPVTVNASDPTGLTATVNIPSGATVGTSFTLSVSYTNADGTVATGSASFTIAAAPPSDITSFTIAQSV